MSDAYQAAILERTTVPLWQPVTTDQPVRIVSCCTLVEYRKHPGSNYLEKYLRVDTRDNATDTAWEKVSWWRDISNWQSSRRSGKSMLQSTTATWDREPDFLYATFGRFGWMFDNTFVATLPNSAVASSCLGCQQLRVHGMRRRAWWYMSSLTTRDSRDFDQ